MALPGVRTVLQDRFSTLSRTDIPDGIRTAIIARRNNLHHDGPVVSNVTERDAIDDPAAGDRVLVSATGTVHEFVGAEWVDQEEEASANPSYRAYGAPSERDVVRAFGRHSELHRAYLEAVSGGAARVVLIPIDADVDDEDITGDEIMTQVFEAAEILQPDIIVLWGRGSHKDDGTADELPKGYYASATSGFVADVAARCKLITDRSNPVFAVMGLEPMPDAEKELQSPATYFANFPNMPDRNALGEQDYGSYVSIVGNEIKTVGYPDEYGWSNGAAVYGGFVSSLNSENAPTGKRLFNVRGLKFAPTRTQQLTLIDKGIVPIGLNTSRQAVAVDGLTHGLPSSDFTRLSTMRIVFDTIQLVRRATEPFVGTPATLNQRNSLETAVTSALRSMMVQGALLEADSLVSYYPRENRATVDLVLVPAFEMRNIDISISIQL